MKSTPSCERRANNQTKTYGQTVTTAGSSQFTSSGLVNSETIGSVTLAINNNGASVNGPVGSDTITPSLATGGTFNPANYTITYNAGTLTVSAATLTVTATGTLVYGSDPTNAVYVPHYATLQGTDTVSVITGSANFSTDATATNHVGPNYVAHVVDVGTLSSPNYTFTAGPDGVLTITNKALFVTNVLANDRVYDGTTSASLNAAGAGLNGLVNGDDASVSLISTNATGVFANKNAGIGKPVSVSGLFTVGDLGTNYILIQPTATASIGALPVTVTAVADTRIYNGTVSSAGVPTPSPALAAGDVGSFSQTFDNRNAGTGKTLTPSGSVSDGNGGTNYSLTFAASATGEIDPKPITVTAVADSKGYDGTTSSAGTPGISPALVSGDTAGFAQAFSNKNAGTGKTLVASGLVADGNGGANYAVTFANNTSGVITQKPITVTAVATTNNYDGTTSSAGVPLVAPGVASGDSPNFTQAYATRNAGTSKTINPAGSVTDGNGGANYSVTFVANNAGEIDTRAITVTAAADSKVYDGTTGSLAVPGIIPSLVGGDTPAFTQTFASRNAAPSIPLIPSGSVSDGNGGANYAVTFVNNTNGAITVKPITVTAVTSSKVYDGTTGSPAIPSVSPGVASGDTANFSESYDTKHAVTGKTLTPSGAVTDGNGGANYSVTFANDSTGVITAKPITVTAVAASKAYDGNTSSAGTPSVSPAVAAGDTANFSQTYDTPNGGSGKTLTPSGSVMDGNSGADYNVTFVNNSSGAIAGAALTVTVNHVSRGYGAANPAFTVSYTNFVNGETLATSDVTGNPALATGADTNSPIGAYYITNSIGTLASSNYTFNLVDGTLTVTNVPLTVTADNQTKVYGAMNPALTASYGGLVNGESASDTNILTGSPDLSTVATPSSGVAGSPYAIVATNGTLVLVSSNYYLVFANGALSVTPATVTPVITASDKVYDGTASATISSRSLTGVLFSDDVTLSGGSATFPDKNAGINLTVTATGLALAGTTASDYVLSSTTATATATITPATLTVSATGVNKVYDGTTAATVSLADNRVTGDTLADNYTAATFANRNAGLGKVVSVTGISISGPDAGNYTANASASATADILTRPITVTGAANSKPYDGTTSAAAAPTITSGSLGTGDMAAFSETYDTKDPGTGKTMTPAGLVSDGNGGANYQVTLTASANGVITAASLTVTANAQSKFYGQTLALGSGSTQFTSSGLQNGETIGSVTLASSGGAASATVSGSPYTITPSAATGGTFNAANYSITYNTGALTVNPATLTVAANNQARGYGAANPAFTVSYTNFVNGETLGTSDVTGSPALGTSANTNSPIGAYAITNSVGTLASTNYTFLLVPGVLSVTNVPLTVTADNKTKVYGTANPALTASYSGLVNGESASDTNILTGSPGLSTAATPASGVAGSPYAIVATNGTLMLVSSNYYLVFANGALSVTPATVSAVITASGKTYDGTAAATISSRSLTGVLFSDDVTLSGGTANFPNRNAGINRTVTATGLSLAGTTAPNYVLASSSASTTATINPQAITVTAATNTKLYDGTTSAAALPTITSGTLISPDTAAFIETYDTPLAGTGKTLTPSGAVNDGNGGANYAITFVNDLTGVVNAALTYWDPTGSTGQPANTSGTWEGNMWSASVAGTATPIPFAEGNLPVFSAGVGTTGNTFTVTANANHLVAGIFNGGITGDNYSTNLFLTGSGILSIANGLQGFLTVANASTTIGNVLAGTGGIQNQNSGSLFLYGNNTYSGGTSLGTSAGLNFNNNNSFGTGSITNAVSLTVLATPSSDGFGHAGATGPITIANAVQTYGLGGQFIITGIAAAPVTFSGPWLLAGPAGTTAQLDVRTITGGTATWTISGPISGAANLTKLNTATLTLSGANTFSGQTVVKNGTIGVSSLNKVVGGTASSNLGAPTTAANGTIGLGATTTAGVLIYTGAGETTDRVLNLAGTTAGGTIQSDGTGALVFTSDLTASGVGAKTLTLQGSNTANNTINGKIVNSSSGATSVSKAGTGTWTLNGANTFTGTTTLGTGGLLNLGNALALGSGAFTIGGNGFFDNTSGADLTVANVMTLSGGSPTYVGSAKNMTINGAVTLSTANRTITVSANTLTLGAAVGQDASARNLTKAGNGTLKLLGVNTYSGITTISGGTLTIGGAGQLGSGNYASAITDNASLVYNSTAAQTLGGVISGTGSLTQQGPGPLTLSAAETYSGATIISSGTLTMIANSSLANGSSISIAAGGILDVQGRASAAFALGSSATLTASGSGIGINAANIKGAVSGTVSLGSQPISLTFTPSTFNGDSTHQALYVSQGTLVLNGNAFTVNNASGTPLGLGTYALVRQATGNITSSGTYSVAVIGSGLAGGNTAFISVSGGDVNLIVRASAAFSGLSASPSVSYGSSSLILSGKVSGTGPTYPASGETVTVVINGNTQTTTINDATGDFSINYNSSTFPASITPYTITYSYAGSASLTSASSSGTSLTVTPAALSITANAQSKTYGQTVTFGSGSSLFTSLGLKNGETVGSVTLACSGGAANSPVSSSPYTITPSAAAGGTFNANNYAIAYNNGALTVNPAVLTATANDLTRPYGGTNPVFTVTYTNFVNGETLGTSDVSGSPFLSTSAVTNSPIGVYVITNRIGTLTSSNYSFNLVNGNLTVTNIPLTVTADNKTKVYGTANPALTASYSGLVNGESASDTNILTGSPGLSTAASATSGVAGSPYAIVATNGTLTMVSSNYYLVFANGTLSVTPATVAGVITASDKVYDGTSAATITSRSLTGVLFSDDVTLTGGSATFPAKNSGVNLTVTATGLSLAGTTAPNYILASSTVSAMASISPAALTVSATGVNKVYDGTTAATVTLTDNRLSGDTLTDSYTGAIFANRNAGLAKPVSVTGIGISGPDAGNYTANSTASAVADITVRAITVTAAANSRPYNGTTSAAANPTITTGSLGSGDTAGFSETYDTKDPGTGKTMTPGGSVLDGNGGANYNVTLVASANGVITTASLSVTANNQSKTYGQTLSFGSGSTQFTSIGLQNGETIGSVTLASSGGAASAPVSGSPYTITPSAATGGTFNPANYSIAYNTGILTVNASSSATALASSVNPSGPGTNVTFTATVSGSPATPDSPTGNVVFSANGTPFATNALVSGVASASIASLPLGTNAMVAHYVGDGNFLGGNGSLDQVVKNFITYSTNNILVSITSNNNGTFTLNLVGTPGAQYYIIGSSDVSLPVGSWTPVANSTNTVSDPGGAWSMAVSNSAPAFYRSVAVNPAP